jgi:hypothetical protein
MSLSDELEKLKELHEGGALTDDEFATAKERVLAAGPPDSSPGLQAAPVHGLGASHVDEQVAQLDREWELERQQYMVVGRYGSQSLPTEGGSVVAGMIVAAFGLLWTLFAAGIASAFAAVAPFGNIVMLFPLFGVLFIVLGVGSAVTSYNKASAYRRAEQLYKQRREALLRRQGEVD